MVSRFVVAVACLLCAIVLPYQGRAQTTPASTDLVEAIRARGLVRCGVSTGAIGFSMQGPDQKWTGMNVELCRGLAAAVFGDASKVEFIPVSTNRRFAALRGGEIDILARMNAWSFSREFEPGIAFTAPYYYGGYAFLTRRSNGIISALELSGASVCTLAGSVAENAVTNFFQRHEMKHTLVRAETWSDVMKAYNAKRCLVAVSNRVLLAYERDNTPDPREHTLLPETIGSEIFGPIVPSGQQAWERIVRWLIHGLVAAEQYGIGQTTLDEARRSPSVDVRRLLGLQGNFGAQLGLKADWLATVIAAIGNYGEIFERNLGAKSPLLLSRDRNALIRDGGVMVAPSFR